MGPQKRCFLHSGALPGEREVRVVLEAVFWAARTGEALFTLLGTTRTHPAPSPPSPPSGALLHLQASVLSSGPGPWPRLTCPSWPLLTQASRHLGDRCHPNVSLESNPSFPQKQLFPPRLSTPSFDRDRVV